MTSAQESTMSQAQAPNLLAVNALRVHTGDKVLDGFGPAGAVPAWRTSYRLDLRRW